MFRVLSALKGSKSPSGDDKADANKKTGEVLTQVKDFEVALRAMDYVLDDRTTKGLALLQDQAKTSSDQTINVLAQGVIEFLEATLSFEVNEMKKASDTLAKAEQLSLKSRQAHQKANLKSSSYYPAGTVYAVTYTESLLLHALLMLFSESMMEAAKALLKLRKANSMLHEIMGLVKDAEHKKKHRSQSKSSLPVSSSNEGSEKSSVSSNNTSLATFDIPEDFASVDHLDGEVLKLAAKVHDMRLQRLAGSHIGNSPAANRLRTELGLDALKELSRDKITEHTCIFENLDGTQPTIDEYIHSGAKLCFGILQVVLSLLPPTIGAVLSIVGFRGSREEGLRLIWDATRERNIHGCIGLLALMFYYDGPFQFTDDDFDIPPVSKSGGIKTSEDELNSFTLLHPGKLLENALLQARALFPNSALWLLNEARMLSSEGRLKEAVALMDSIDIEKIHMRQVKILMMFDRANTLVHLHEYERAAEELLALVNISDWSHAFYTYFAGCCYLEEYRMCELNMADRPEKKDYYKEKAIKLIFGAPEYLGKKTFKSKNLPLDRFMLRKVEQFKKVQKKLKLENPLDAIATSPIHELVYFYNGYNRMTKDGLQMTKKLLTEYHNPAVDLHEKSQELVRDLLLSLTLRRLGEVDEGCKLLDEKVLPLIINIQNGKVKYVKRNDDPWAYPTALYERALFNWKINGLGDLKQCREWLLRAQNYYTDDYELSTRVGMKIKAAVDRVEQSL
ncbi:hypothetical protein KAFR_0A01550 [Kazachstania africana CBS 2517]|uniref:Inclusion body clearance protein IML2 n=1 Tax=Kazachstania africana (strain ATCC 22294 / BCRC 22015 / CBS 2517 / CECT 1963 / NBRC 1671 / NRRL Y-8276) TaxID=1071382 RepID=H2AMJ3_KAZAF|nr:hypothetical protein KAFR_0A01550 [Kazachstania africana CBS 2517]CCF55593.1 hypothetical protein KAFR_0A01550 [Kazachstania africana CBS 2517]